MDTETQRDTNGSPGAEDMLETELTGAAIGDQVLVEEGDEGGPLALLACKTASKVPVRTRTITFHTVLSHSLPC